MAISKCTLYKYVKVADTWRYCKVAYHDNSKVKPDIVFVNVKKGLSETHPEGRCDMNHNRAWIDAGTDALKVQVKRKQRLALDEFKRLSGKGSAEGAVVLPDGPGRVTLSAAAEKYFANCEARGFHLIDDIGKRKNRLRENLSCTTQATYSQTVQTPIVL